MEEEFVTVKGKKYYIRDGKLALCELGIIDIAEIEGLENLTQLKELSLVWNGIEEIKGLETLKNLKRLSLGHNNIEKIKGLEQLTSLEKLYLYNNQITEIKGLETLTNLKVLSLDDNLIEEFKGLETLTNLQELHLRNSGWGERNWNQIKEIKGLDNLTNLEMLDLRGNSIREIKGLDNLTKLRALYLDKNQIRKIKGLESLKKLQELDLWGNQIAEIKGLENLINLQILNLGWNPNISEIKGLDNLTNLQRLNLDHSPITKLKGLETLTNLRELKIHGHKLKGLEYEVIEKGAEAVVKYCQEKKVGTLIPIDPIIKEMEQELGVSLQHIGKVLGRFFQGTLWDYYSVDKHHYPVMKTPEELLQFIHKYYTTALLWPGYKGMIRAKYYSRTFLSQWLSVEDEGESWRSVAAADSVKDELLTPWNEYAGLLAFDKEMLQLIEEMSFRKEFVHKWVEKTEKMYRRINRSKNHVSPSGRTQGLKSRQQFVDRYVLGDRIKFYGRLRKYLAKELNVPIKDLSAMKKAYSDFWKRWLNNEIRFYDKYYYSLIGTLGRTVQVDSSFWIESDYYALLVQEVIVIITELLTRLDMEYSHTVKLKLMEYFKYYFGEWEYWSFRGFLSWCEKVSSGTMSLEIPLPSGDEKERAERERKHKDDLEYHKEGFADYLKYFEALYEKLSG